MSSFAVQKKDYLVSAFERMYAHEYYEQHRAEITSTSPYAVTDKLPALRIVDNPITTGSGHTSAVHSTDHYGFFGGYKGSSVNGGGGNWSLDTTVQFDHVNMCPVTNREFTDKELERYHDDWTHRLESYARDEARYVEYYQDMNTLNYFVKWHGGMAILNPEQMEDLCMVSHSGKEIKEVIEKATSKPQEIPTP